MLFYRHSRTEYAGSGFQYEGRFRYVSHSGSMPTHFVLQRVDDVAHIVAQDVDAMRAEESYREGGQTSTLVDRYERNPSLRTAAIKIHGTTCQGCGFSFADVYGPRGEGFIEVHHLRPIASYPGEIAVDPRTDMAVLCANCHRMVHRKASQPLAIAELRQLVATMRSG